MEQIKNQLVEQMTAFIADAQKNSKSAHARMRTATLNIDKLGKEFRRISKKKKKK